MTGAQGMFMRRNSLPVDTSWHNQGACRDADDTLFFHPYGETGPAKRSRIADAKAICAKCPMAQICRDQARERREQHGTWGGESEDERVAWLRAQQPSRKRKKAAA